jgi:hypothetical protein
MCTTAVVSNARCTQKFSVPTVADGHVYLANRNQIAVYPSVSKPPFVGTDPLLPTA